MVSKKEIQMRGKIVQLWRPFRSVLQIDLKNVMTVLESGRGLLLNIYCKNSVALGTESFVLFGLGTRTKKDQRNVIFYFF